MFRLLKEKSKKQKIGFSELRGPQSLSTAGENRTFLHLRVRERERAIKIYRLVD